MATEQEILEFVIKLKMEEMKRGLNASEQEIRDFHSKAAREFKATGAEVEKLERQGKDLSKEWDKSTKNMEKSMKGLQTAATVALTSITAAAGVSIKTFADFEAQLNSLQAVSGATASQMDALEAKAQSLGASTKYSASQMAETSFELSKLGFVSEEIIASIDGIVAAAAASGVSLADAGELVAGTVRGFGLDASEAVKVADVLASAANASALSMSDLSLSMKYVAPIAAASNQSLTDMTGIMGILANNMIKGEQAGTSLRAMMARLQNPSSEMSKIMGKLGLDIEDADGKMKRMPVILGELREKMQGLKETTKSRVLGELFGTEALSAASVLMNTSNEQLGEMVKKMEDSTGASKEMADIMQQGINHELAILKSKTEAAGIAFGEEFAPATEEAIRLLGDFLQYLAEIPDSSKQMILQLGLLGGAATAAGVGLKGLNGMMVASGVEATALAGKFKALHTAILGLPGLIGAGIGLAANYGINAYADSIDQDTEQREQALKDDKTNERLKTSSAALRKTYNDEMAKIDAQEKEYRRTLKGLELDKALEEIAKSREKARDLLGDMSALTLDDMKASAKSLKDEARDIQVEINQLKKAPQKLRELKEELAKERKKGGRTARAADLEKQIGGIDLVENSKRLRQLQGQVQRLNQLQNQFQTGINERQKQVKNSPTTPNTELEKKLAEEASNEEEKRQLNATDTYFKELDKRLDKKKETLERELALTEQSMASQNDVGQRLAEIAMSNVESFSRQKVKSLSKFSGRCWQEVWQSLKKAGLTADLTGVGSAHAYQAIPGFQQSQSWKEMKWDQKSKLPAGAVVVWEKGNSKSGHISIADGKGNEISDAVARQGQQHYGGGKAHVFIHKDSKGTFGNEAEQQAIVTLQKEYNKEIQLAIAFQARFTKGSKAWEKAEENIVKLKKEAGQLGIDLIKAETEARKKAAEEAERMAKQQLDNYKAMLQAVYGVQQSIQGEAETIAKELAQLGMTSLQKAQDDFDRNIAKHTEKIAELHDRLAATNVNEEQRKAILEEIEGLDKDILNLRTQQEQKMRVMYADETIKEYYEMHEDILKSEMRQVDAKKRKLALETQLGQLNPEERAKRLLEINHQELKVLERQKAIEAEKSTDILLSKDQQKAAAERVLDLETRISDVTNQQLLIAQELNQQRTQFANMIKGEALAGLQQQLEIMNKMVGASSALNLNFMGLSQVFDRIIANGDIFTQGIDPSGKETKNPLGPQLLNAFGVKEDGGINGLNLKSLKLNLGEDGAVSASTMGGIIGVALELKKMVDGLNQAIMDQVNNLIGDENKLKADADAFILELADIENRIADLKLKGAKDRGEDVSQLEIELVRKRAQEELRALENQAEQIKQKKTGMWGLIHTREERQEIEQFYKSLGLKREEIEQRTNQEIEELRRQHLSVIMNAEQEVILATQNNHLDRMAFDASKTADPMDDIAAEEARRKTEANRQWASDLNAARDPALPLELQQQKEALANDAQRLRYEEIAKEMDDKRKKAREGLNKAQAESVRLLDLETAALRAQQTANPYDDLFADADLELEKLRQDKEKELAEEGLTEEKKHKIREFYRQKELLARQKLQKAFTDLQKSEVQRVADEYKELLNQQATYIRESIEVETERYQDLIETEEVKLRAAQEDVKAEREALEALQKKKAEELGKWNPDDGVQSADFRKALKDFDPTAAAYQGVDELSNVANRPDLDSVSGETKRKGLLEQAELQEMAAKNQLRKEEINQKEYVRIMQEAQLMRVKAAEMELATADLTTRRKLELEEEWANAYETYQELARQAIEYRYATEEEKINDNIAKNEELAAGYQKNIDGYKKAIDDLKQAAEEKIKPIEAAIKTAERSTRDWADAWTDVTEGINRATAAMNRQREEAQSGGGRVTSAANQGLNYAQGTDGQKYQTTSELWGLIPKMATGGTVPPGFPNDTYLAALSTGETVLPPPLPLGEMSPAGTLNNITNVRQVTISGNHIQSDVDMYGVAMQAIRDNEQENRDYFGTHSGRWA